jgi:hypothetical protein
MSAAAYTYEPIFIAVPTDKASYDLRHAAHTINVSIASAGDCYNRAAVEAEIASCAPCIRDGLRVETVAIPLSDE